MLEVERKRIPQIGILTQKRLGKAVNNLLMYWGDDYSAINGVGIHTVLSLNQRLTLV